MSIDFDEGKYFLGSLCKHKHEYKDTGKSVRIKRNYNCRQCARDTVRQKYTDKPDFYREKSKRFYYNHKDSCLKKSRQYNDSHPEKIKEISHRYRHNNKEQLKEIRYKSNQKHRMISKNRINDNMRSGIWRSIQDKNGQSWKNFVSYSLQTLCNHLESHFDERMNWDNQGSYWHIDHIIPLSFFEFESHKDLEFKLAWHLNNLRPLSARDNDSKSNKLIRPLIEQIDFR